MADKQRKSATRRPSSMAFNLNPLPSSKTQQKENWNSSIDCIQKNVANQISKIQTTPMYLSDKFQKAFYQKNKLYLKLHETMRAIEDSSFKPINPEVKDSSQAELLSDEDKFTKVIFEKKLEELEKKFKQKYEIQSNWEQYFEKIIKEKKDEYNKLKTIESKKRVETLQREKQEYEIIREKQQKAKEEEEQKKKQKEEEERLQLLEKKKKEKHDMIEKKINELKEQANKRNEDQKRANDELIKLKKSKKLYEEMTENYEKMQQEKLAEELKKRKNAHNNKAEENNEKENIQNSVEGEGEEKAEEPAIASLDIDQNVNNAKPDLDLSVDRTVLPAQKKYAVKTQIREENEEKPIDRRALKVKVKEFLEKLKSTPPKNPFKANSSFILNTTDEEIKKQEEKRILNEQKKENLQKMKELYKENLENFKKIQQEKVQKETSKILKEKKAKEEKAKTSQSSKAKPSTLKMYSKNSKPFVNFKSSKNFLSDSKLLTDQENINIRNLSLAATSKPSVNFNTIRINKLISSLSVSSIRKSQNVDSIMGQLSELEDRAQDEFKIRSQPNKLINSNVDPEFVYYSLIKTKINLLKNS